MGSSGFDEFLKQPGVIKMLILTVGAGILYIVMMAVVMRRAAMRRQQRRAAATGGQLTPAMASAGGFGIGNLGNLLKMPSLNFLKMALPTSSDHLPEPELDMLVDAPHDMAEPVEEVAELEPAESSPAMLSAPVEEVEAVYVPDEVPVTSAYEPKPAVRREPADAADAVEVLRVFRDLTDGSLIIQLGDKQYYSVSEIETPELARRFSAVVRELGIMAGPGLNRMTPASPASRPAEAPAETKSIGRMNVKPEPTPKQGVLKTMTQQMLGQKKPEPPRPGPSLADAVEEFLQFKLANSPQFATRSIHIRPSHDQGVQIEVDGHFYAGIGDVVDPDVRDFLFNMMREWEARQ